MAETGHSRSALQRSVERIVLAFLQLLNPFMKRALESPLHGLFSRWFVLLSFTGRKSGRRIVTPTSYFARNGDLVLTTKRPWWRNLEHHGAVDATVRGRRSRWEVQMLAGREAVELLSGAPGWFAVLGALDDGVLGRLTGAELERSVGEGRVAMRLRRQRPDGSAPPPPRVAGGREIPSR